MVALVAGLFAFIEIGRGLGSNAADGLFLVRFGAEFLPYMTMALGVVTFVVSLSYTAGLGQFNRGAFFVALLLGFAAILIIERVAFVLDFSVLYPILWLTINIISSILGLFLWNVASDVCDTRQAKRLFSLFTSAGIVGGILGNSITGPLAKTLGTENLLLLYAALLLISLAVTRRVARQFFRPAPKREAGADWIAEIRTGFDYVRGSRLMQLIAFASILFSILYFSLYIPFNQVVSTSFASDADVAGFLGLFSTIITITTLAVSLFIANRLYARIGVVNSLLLLPITYLLGFILIAVNFSLAFAVIARLAQMVIMNGIGGAAWGTFFNVVPPEQRSQVQSFDGGVTSQIGVVISGALILLGGRVLTTTQLFGMGMIAALACALLVWQMRRAYGVALLAALRAGFVDVFTATQRGFQNLGADTNALRAALAGLADPKPTVRCVSAEILGKLNARQAIEPLIRVLEDPDPTVLKCALAALVQLDARQAIARIAAHVADAQPEIRAAAIDALGALSPQARPEFIAALQDPDPHVRARAAVTLHHAGDHARAQTAHYALLDSNDPATRIAGLAAAKECPECFVSSRIAEFLRDDSVGVRVASAQALGAFKDKNANQALLNALDDPDGRVRRAAATALQSSDGDIAAILHVLNTGSERAQQAALDALEGRGAAAKSALEDWALAKISHVAQLRAWAADLARLDNMSDLRGVKFLRDLLREREWQIEQRILHALALIAAGDAIDTIAKGLRSNDQEMRAQALEALDTLGDKRIARGLIPLLEETTPGVARTNPQAILKELMMHPDAWLRALAVQAASELFARDFNALVARAREDAAPVVREAAAAAVALIGGNMTETSKTLGTMDRILFLRQVPLFGNLAPEDLQQITEIATERVIPANEYLCREGETGDELFVIVAGQVSVTKGSNGTVRTLRTLQAGQHIGELAILREQPRSANVIADRGSVRALVIRGNALKAILRDRPEVAMAMLSSLAERLSTN